MSGGLRADLLRLACILAVTSVLGIGANALSRRPVPLLAADGPGALPDRASRISVNRLRRELGSGRALFLLDVRSSEGFKADHAPQALNAPAPEFLDRYRELGLSSVLKAADGVVVICEGGDCSAGDRVAKLLQGLGHPEVRVLEGGWEAYLRGGLERTGK